MLTSFIDDFKSLSKLPKTLSSDVKKVEKEAENEYQKIKDKILYGLETGFIRSESFLNKYIIPIMIGGELFYISILLLILAAVKIFTKLFPSPMSL